MYAGDDDISVGSNPGPPSSAAQHAAMALAILGPNHRGNVTFEAIDQDGEGLGAEGGSRGEERTPEPEVQFAEPAPSPRERLSSTIRQVYRTIAAC